VPVTEELATGSLSLRRTSDGTFKSIKTRQDK
jgi:hypothetical protein